MTIVAASGKARAHAPARVNAQQTEQQAAALARAWHDAIGLLQADLRRRDAAPRTARAYCADLGQFAALGAHARAGTRGRRPQGRARIRRRALRARHGAEHERAQAGGARALFDSQREHGTVAQNPAELVSTPRRARSLPRVLKAREAAALLDAIPAGGPLELRDRALFELAYACGLRAEELVSLGLADVDHDAEQLRVEGKGRKTRLRPVGEVALQARSPDATRQRGAPALRRATARERSRRCS